MQRPEAALQPRGQALRQVAHARLAAAARSIQLQPEDEEWLAAPPGLPCLSWAVYPDQSLQMWNFSNFSCAWLKQPLGSWVAWVACPVPSSPHNSVKLDIGQPWLPGNEPVSEDWDPLQCQGRRTYAMQGQQSQRWH